MSNSLWPHGLQNARLPCPSPTPRACSNSCLASRWCHPTISSSVIPFSSCLQSFPASVFSNESALHIRLPKYWSFSFSISPSNEYSGLISFGIDWFDLHEVQGTLKSLLQHNLIKNIHFLVGCAVLGHLSHAQLFATPWTVACQSPLSMEFSRQENLACPSPFLLDLVVQLLSHVWHLVTLWTHARLPSPSLSPRACSI